MEHISVPLALDGYKPSQQSLKQGSAFISSEYINYVRSFRDNVVLRVPELLEQSSRAGDASERARATANEDVSSRVSCALEVEPRTTSKRPLKCRHLPSEFPVKVPQLKTSIPVHHRWVDTVGNVHGHPDLSKWTAHSDLGRIVTEIVTELRSVVSQMSASKSLVSSSRSSSSASTASTASLSQYRAPSSKQPPQQPVQQQPDASKIQRTQMPVVPVVFSELDDLSVDQLEELNTDRHLLNKFVRDLRLVTEFTKLRDEVLHCNMDIANTTLGYESELRDLQAVVATQRTELHAAQQALAEKQARRQRIMARHRPDALLEQLAAATKAMDNTTDELASQFVQGDMDVARFLATYMPQRNVYHERTLKLAHVTNQQQ